MTVVTEKSKKKSCKIFSFHKFIFFVYSKDCIKTNLEYIPSLVINSV